MMRWRKNIKTKLFGGTTQMATKKKGKQTTLEFYVDGMIKDSVRRKKEALVVLGGVVTEKEETIMVSEEWLKIARAISRLKEMPDSSETQHKEDRVLVAR